MIDSVVRRLRLVALKAAAVAGRQRPGSGPSTEHWVRVRAPVKEQDRVLLSDTHLWLRGVPPRLHPKQLCRYHPRLANRLAQCWGNHDQVRQFMDELLIDRRGGRKGLPERVMAELYLLDRFHVQRPGSRRGAPAPRQPARSPASPGG